MPRLDPLTALLVVDVQNDFADPGGALYVRGGEQTVPVVNRLVEEARAAGAPVLYSQDWHPPRTPHFDIDGGLWPVHCVAGTWGAELHPALVVDGPVVRKGSGGEDGYSAFSVRDPETGEQEATELGSLLRACGVRRVVVVGLARDVCVTATALDARRLGYEVEVVMEATRPVELNPGDDARAAAEMTAAGVTLA